MSKKKVPLGNTKINMIFFFHLNYYQHKYHNSRKVTIIRIIVNIKD